MDVLPYFKKSEDYYGGASHYHGVGGPLSVLRHTHPNPLTDAFIEAAVHTGHRVNYDFSGAEIIGAGYADTTTMRDGRRCNVALAFLVPARDQRRGRSQGGSSSGERIRALLRPGSRADAHATRRADGGRRC